MDHNRIGNNLIRCQCDADWKASDNEDDRLIRCEKCGDWLTTGSVVERWNAHREELKAITRRCETYEELEQEAAQYVTLYQKLSRAWKNSAKDWRLTAEAYGDMAHEQKMKNISLNAELDELSKINRGLRQTLERGIRVAVLSERKAREEVERLLAEECRISDLLSDTLIDLTEGYDDKAKALSECERNLFEAMGKLKKAGL